MGDGAECGAPGREYMLGLLQRIVPLCLVAVLFFSTATPGNSDPVGKAFELEQFFVGEVLAQGSFSSAFAGTQQDFKMTMNGTMKGGILVIEQEVRRADGSVELATWEIKRSGNKRYTGTRTYAVEPLKIEIKKNRVEWSYKLDMPVDGGGRRTLSFEDVMVLRNDGTVFRRGKVKKFGLTVAEVETVYERKAGGAVTTL